MIELDKVIFIGRILKPFGINGMVKIFPLTDFPERFLKLNSVYFYNELKNEFIENNKSGDFNFLIEKAEVKSLNDIKLKFKEYDSINEVEIFSKLYLCVDEELRVKLKKGNYYYYDLIGYEVYDKKVKLGTLDSISNSGGNDILFVKTRKTEVLIPFIKEFVKKVDVNNKIIKTDLIEGFYEQDEI